jgi:hypothetical protein
MYIEENWFFEDAKDVTIDGGNFGEGEGLRRGG